MTNDTALNVSIQLYSLSEHSTKMDDTNVRTVVSILEKIVRTYHRTNNTEVCVTTSSEV